MKRTIVLALLLAGCGKAKPKEPAKEAPKVVVEPKVEAPKKQETTAAVLGKTPAAPFGKAAKLKLGMSEADAKMVAPEFFSANVTQPVKAPDDALEYALVFAFGRLARIEIKSTSFARFEKLATEAWGPGATMKNVLGGDQLFWFDPATHTRARADSSDLELSEYIPLAELLGPDPVAIAALPKPIYGASPEQLKRDYGTQMKPDDKLLHIYLPPAEWDREHVSVFAIDSERKKQVVDYSFDINDEGVDAAKAATLAAFEKKWGKPRLAKPYGSDKDKMVFHKKNPLIEVGRNVEDKGWTVAVRAVDDACGGPCYKGL